MPTGRATFGEGPSTDSQGCLGLEPDWPGLGLQPRQTEFDSDALGGVASELEALHGEVTGAVDSGTPTELQQRVTIPYTYEIGGFSTSEVYPFGRTSMSQTFYNISLYHHDAATVLSREFTNLLADLQSAAQGLRVSAQTLRTSEDDTQAAAAQIERPAAGDVPAADVPAADVPVGGVESDGSFG